MFSVLNCALSWAMTSFGNTFCMKKKSRLMKASETIGLCQIYATRNKSIKVTVSDFGD